MTVNVNRLNHPIRTNSLRSNCTLSIRNASKTKQFGKIKNFKGREKNEVNINRNKGRVMVLIL